MLYYRTIDRELILGLCRCLSAATGFGNEGFEDRADDGIVPSGALRVVVGGRRAKGGGAGVGGDLRQASCRDGLGVDRVVRQMLMLRLGREGLTELDAISASLWFCVVFGKNIGSL